MRTRVASAIRMTKVRIRMMSNVSSRVKGEIKDEIKGYNIKDEIND